MSPRTRKSQRRPSCPEKVNVLLIGGGGREHALAWQIKKSPRLGRLWLTHASNAGLADIGTGCPVKLDTKEIWRLSKWCDREEINLVIVGPEAPLAEGIADELSTDSRVVFGVGKEAARLESDKGWAKQLMRSAAIPTAEGKVFTNLEHAREYFNSRKEDLPVIKASGLAAGKGVIVPETAEEGLEALDQMMHHRRFGDAGETVVIEEQLTGPELSVLALVDGRNIYVLETCQDHKRAYEGDAGPNTGGMGAYCPVPDITTALMSRIEQEILVPTIDALRREEIEYRGVLYAGLMLTPAGPKVLEFNVRFGDPECQPLMMRLKGDFIEIAWATATGMLHETSIDWDHRPACCIVMASDGYPGDYPKGVVINGLKDVKALPDVNVFHAGTKRRESDIVTNGGRVLSVTALGDTLEAARDQALKACDMISFEGAHYRRDIAHRAIKR